MTPEEVHAARFSKPVVGRRGYDEDEVDAFLDRVVDALEGRTRLTAAEVHEVSFGKPPIGRRGYYESEVDDFLDRVAAHFAHHPPPPAPPPRPLTDHDIRTARFPQPPSAAGATTPPRSTPSS